MSKHLFNEFEPVSSKQWKQQIQYELKGADYNETLVWESPEGIKVKPFYHADENQLKFESPISNGFKIIIFESDSDVLYIFFLKLLIFYDLVLPNK